MQKRTVTFRNDVADIEKLEPFLEEVGEALNLQPSLVFNLNLAVEEAITNVMMYAYEEPGHTFTLSAQGDESLLVFQITDSGKPFDPTTQIAEADTSLSVEERPIGGLGMFLIKNMMDEVSYHRSGQQNVLTLTKKIK